MPRAPSAIASASGSRARTPTSRPCSTPRSRMRRCWPAPAIPGLDAVRFLGGADYAGARLRYHEQPALGPGVAHMFVDAVLTSGATAHLAFCPTAGAVVERAAVHASGQTFFLRIPMWGPLDA